MCSLRRRLEFGIFFIAGSTRLEELTSQILRFPVEPFVARVVRKRKNA
jgi:hypothetical protein